MLKIRHLVPFLFNMSLVIEKKICENVLPAVGSGWRHIHWLQGYYLISTFDTFENETTQVKLHFQWSYLKITEFFTFN